MRCQRIVAAVALVALAGPEVAYAHRPVAKVEREMVRLQGYRTTAPRGTNAERLVLVILGVEHEFYATERRRFGFETVPLDATPARQDRLVLQGDRETLAALASSRPDQRVTILAERRPGAAELFVLVLDLCPTH